MTCPSVKGPDLARCVYGLVKSFRNQTTEHPHRDTTGSENRDGLPASR